MINRAVGGGGDFTGGCGDDGALLLCGFFGCANDAAFEPAVDDSDDGLSVIKLDSDGATVESSSLLSSLSSSLSSSSLSALMVIG